MTAKKKLTHSSLVATIFLSISAPCYATLHTNSVLSFNTGYGACDYYGTCFIRGGSYFGIDAGVMVNDVTGHHLDTSYAGDGTIQSSERTPITMNDGLIIGSTQSASGSHTGIPGCTAGEVDPEMGTTCNDTSPSSESPTIDAAWGGYRTWDVPPSGNPRYYNVSGITGMHSSVQDTNIISSSGNTASIDFSGWGMHFGGHFINLGSGAWGGNADGVANIVCGNDCENGDTFTLSYTATFPVDTPTFAEFSDLDLSGQRYELQLQGSISTTYVSLPASVWLFATGIAGLFQFGRRRNKKLAMINWE